MASNDSIGEGFLSRWSRRKAQARQGALAPPLPDRAAAASELAPQPAPQRGGAEATAAGDVRPAEQAGTADTSEPAPTLADVAQLTPDSDFTRFVAGDVQPEVKNAALRKLFSDPHFNRMDGLDVYIDDYNVPDPVPSAILRKMAQAKFLGLVTDAPPEESAPAVGALEQDTCDVVPARAGANTPPADRIAAHEDADLQLQPHDAAGRTGAAPSAGHDTGRER